MGNSDKILITIVVSIRKHKHSNKMEQGMGKMAKKGKKLSNNHVFQHLQFSMQVDAKYTKSDINPSKSQNFLIMNHCRLDNVKRGMKRNCKDAKNSGNFLLL